MKDSYILESRKILESDIWNKPPLYFKVWHYLLLKAQHKDFGGLKRGQLFTSINEIREACSYFAGYRKITPSRKEIFGILEWLRNPYEGNNGGNDKGTMIVTTKVTHGMIISIVNYGVYQDPKTYEGNNGGNDETHAKELRKERQGNNINKNVLKNDKNISPPVSPPLTQKAMLNECLSDKVLPLSVKVALEDWIQYKAERNERYKLAGMKSLVTRAINASKEYGSKKVVTVINDSMASGYKGIVWDRCARAKNMTEKFNNAPKREYDMREVEAMLIATN